MFRRRHQAEPGSASESASESTQPGVKGRPTPTRKEAEAAARKRAQAAKDPKAARNAVRAKRSDAQGRLREAMRTGDDRYLPTRDKGPVRRFVRDFVDARISVAEFLLPLLLTIMVLQYSGNAELMRISNGLWSATILLTIVDTLWLVFRLRRALRARFPDEPLRGTNFYAIVRVLQIRWLRMPKPQVRVGGRPK